MMKEQNFVKRDNLYAEKTSSKKEGKPQQKSKKRIKSGGGEMSRGY